MLTDQWKKDHRQCAVLCIMMSDCLHHELCAGFVLPLFMLLGFIGLMGVVGHVMMTYPVVLIVVMSVLSLTLVGLAGYEVYRAYQRAHEKVNSIIRRHDALLLQREQ
jgi:hypothetical protein